ncbi:hypothetical protein CR513_38773, partial [Mucuna pruriens]
MNQPWQQKFVAYVLLWNTPLICAPLFKKLSRTDQSMPTTRTICSSESRIYAEYASWSSWLPTVVPIISSTILPTTTEDAYSRQLLISRRFDEAACNKQSGVPTICELQQYAIPVKHDRHHPGPQDANQTLQSADSSNLPSQTILNPRGNASVKRQRTTSTCITADVEVNQTRLEAIADSQSHPETTVPLPFPSQTISARKPESDEELLKMF